MESVYKLIETKQSNNTVEFKPPKVIQSGKRNATMYKYACSLQSKGLTDDAITAAMEIENKQICNPPLDDEELQQILGSVFKLEKGVKTPKNQVYNPINIKSNQRNSISIQR